MRRLRHSTRGCIFRFLFASAFPRGTPGTINPNAYPGAPGVIGPHAAFFLPQFGTDYKGGGDYWFYNFAAVTPALPPADRQAFYGSFTRDLCDKYLTVFADFKICPFIFRYIVVSCAVFARSIQDPGH